MGEKRVHTRPRSDKGTTSRTRIRVTFDYDTFMQCYNDYFSGKINTIEFAERCGTSQATISNKLNYILKHDGNVPSYWFTKDGRNLEDILREQKIAELQAEMKANQDGNS